MKRYSSTARSIALVLVVVVGGSVSFLSVYVLFWTCCLPRQSDQQVANIAVEKLHAQFPGVTFFGSARWRNHIDITVSGVMSEQEQSEIRDWLVGLKASRGWDVKIRLIFFEKENWIGTPGGSGHRGPETLLNDFDF